MAFLEIRNVKKSFDIKGKGEPFVALNGISLSVEEGEFVTLIGHSGCGKSTLLDLVAGLTHPTSGSIVCDQKPVRGPGPDRAMVFQNHSLLPWMTCFENVLLGVRQVFRGRLSKDEMRQKVSDTLEMVHLSHAADKYPSEISGGMKQRVGIARALAVEPGLLLLDEPFGALDALTRASLQDELMEIVELTGCTTIMVTHDVDEAILLSDKVVMMTNGPAATIGEIVPIAISKPRDRLMMTSNETANRHREIAMQFLYSKQRKAVTKAA